MFCPRCGVELSDVEGTLKCVPGDMPLSPKMQADLDACFVQRTRMPRDSALRFRVGGTWFCPGCGVRAEMSDGRVVCPHCSRSLNEFIYHLIELHPHRLDPEVEAERKRWWAENRRKAPTWPRQTRGESDG